MELTIINPPANLWDAKSNTAYAALLVLGYDVYAETGDLETQSKWIYVVLANGQSQTIDIPVGYEYSHTVQPNAGFSDTGNLLQNKDNVGLNAVFDAYPSLAPLKYPNWFSFADLKAINSLSLKVNSITNGTIAPAAGDYVKYFNDLVDVLPVPDSGYETFIESDGLFFDYSNQLLMNESKVVNPINVLNPPLPQMVTILDKIFNVDLSPFAAIGNANIIDSKLKIIRTFGVNWIYWDWRSLTDVGDLLKITLTGVNYISGSGCKLILNEGKNDTDGLINEIIGSGTLIFDNLTVPNSPNEQFLIIGAVSSGVFELNIESILVERYPSTPIDTELFDGIYSNNIELGSAPSTNSEYNFIYTNLNLKITLDRSFEYPYFEYCSLFVNGNFIQKIDYNGGLENNIILPETGYIQIKTGVLSKPNPLVLSAAYVRSILGNNSAFTKVDEGVVFNKNVILGDSITVGDHATNINTLSFTGKLALERATVVLGYGFGKLEDFAGNATVLADTVNKYSAAFSNCLDKKNVFIALGTNDYGLNSTSSAIFKGWYEDLVQALKADDPDYMIYCLSPLLRGGETSLLGEYRTAIAEVCAAENCTYINGADIMPNTLTYFAADLLHPNDFGHETIYNYLSPVLATSSIPKEDYQHTISADGRVIKNLVAEPYEAVTFNGDIVNFYNEKVIHYKW